MAYVRRTSTTAARAYVKKAPLRDVPDDGTADERLDRITLEITKRMEAELDRYSVPQLLAGLHKCLQVRVLMLTLRQKGGGTDVGSAVRKYTGNFQAQNAGSGRARSARRTSGRYNDDPDDNIVDLIAAED